MDISKLEDFQISKADILCQGAPVASTYALVVLTPSSNLPRILV